MMGRKYAPVIESKSLAAGYALPNTSNNGMTTMRRCTFVQQLKNLLKICLLVFLIYFTLTWPNQPWHHHLPTTTPPQPVNAITYPGEHIAWTPCGNIADRALECANLTVPVDQFNTNSTSTTSKVLNDQQDTFLIPLIRLRSANPTPSTRNLLLNPGGPGGSGTAFMYQRGAALAAIVGDGFHLLSFDPRGVNRSEPRASCYRHDESLRGELSQVRAKKPVEDSGELWAWTSNFVRACADAMGPRYASYINTPQTAADMNSILNAVGQRGLYYWGFSYGTILGQTYATLFPDRAERVIIDGVANQFDWYESLLDAEMIVDTDRVLEGFADECVRAGEEGGCALASMAGSSKGKLLDLVVEGVAKLKEDPVGVYINDTLYGVLDYWTVWYNGVFPSLYKPAAWRDLAHNLATLFRGNATAAWLAYHKPAWESLGDSLKFISLNDGLSGPENWPVDRLGLLDDLLPFFNQSRFTAFQLDYYFSKQAWAVRRTHNYVPERHVKTAHPLLIMSTTYDPVCPLVSAQGARRVFEGSRLVEVKGYGHCTLAVPSSCVARHVRDFLYEGNLPEKDVQCEADTNPAFAKPEEAIASAESRFFSEEEKQIWMAQQELAREAWLGPWRM